MAVDARTPVGVPDSRSTSFQPSRPCRARRAMTRYIGEVAERLKAPVSKTGMRASASGVRIPPSPPTPARLHARRIPRREHCARTRSALPQHTLARRRPPCGRRPTSRCHGEVSEWPKVRAWKARVSETAPRVRIPPSPPSTASRCLGLRRLAPGSAGHMYIARHECKAGAPALGSGPRRRDGHESGQAGNGAALRVAVPGVWCPDPIAGASAIPPRGLRAAPPRRAS